MEIIKDKDGCRAVSTKKAKFYFSSWCYLWDLALPVHIDIECFTKEYTEIRLHILCFNISFTRISHKCSDKFDKILEELPSD